MNAVEHFIRDYISRHSHPINALLHIVGVPAVLIGIYYLIATKFILGGVLICGGYAAQYFGHEAQGNEVGEITLIKKIWRILKNKRSNSGSL